jgi:hypothetical protein
MGWEFGGGAAFGSRGCILNAAGMNQYLPAQEKEMPARASERPGACPVFLPCEVAQPPKPSASGEFSPESKNVTETALL